jgi:hypothetical protein
VATWAKRAGAAARPSGLWVGAVWDRPEQAGLAKAKWAKN